MDEEKKGNMSNLLARVLTAAVAAPVVVWLTWIGGLPFTLLILVAVGISLYEFLAMVEKSSPVCIGIVWILGVSLAWGSTTTWFLHHAWMVLVLGVMVILLAYLFFPGSVVRGSAERAALSMLAVLYAAGLPACLIHLRMLKDGWAWVLLAMIITWGSDTAAYFSGRAFGKRKLYPLISPKKTWEGAFGGLLGSMLFSFVAWLTFFPRISIIHLLIISLLGGAVGQMGDLVESMIKRSVGVKDSGKLLPGHGGLLDRIDALIFAAPILLFYATYILEWH